MAVGQSRFESGNLTSLQWTASPRCTVARSQTYSWASPAEKVRPLKKKLGRKHIQLKFFGFVCH